MKKNLFLCLCIASILMLAGCSLLDEEHISQSTAEKIAAELTGGDVTYVTTEEADTPNHINYIFTDSKGTAFSITSCLSQDGLDGATIGPYHCSVVDNYGEAVMQYNKEQIEQILKEHGLEDYHVSMRSVDFDIYCGTPEENRDILNQIAAAGAEIDALLDMTYDTDYAKKTQDEYFSYGVCLVPHLHVQFSKKLEGKAISELCVDIASVDFSTSDDTRWTADSLYEAMKSDLDKIEIAE